MMKVLLALSELEYADMAAELSFVCWWWEGKDKPSETDTKKKRLIEKTKGLIRHDRVLTYEN